MSLLIITAVDGKPERPKIDGVRFIDIPYRGFSRGMGEFMERAVKKYAKTIAKYDYIAFMGDDVEYEPLYLASVSEAIAEHWWQPVHASGSHHTYAAMKRAGRLPFVELNCVYSRDFLTHCAPYFTESKSGWGLDVLMGKLHVERYGTEPLVCDAMTMRHVKPVTGGWEIDGVSSGEELNRIIEKYGVGIDWARMG
jgi:hypothetical protein